MDFGNVIDYDYDYFGNVIDYDYDYFGNVIYYDYDYIDFSSNVIDYDYIIVIVIMSTITITDCNYPMSVMEYVTMKTIYFLTI